MTARCVAQARQWIYLTIAIGVLILGCVSSASAGGVLAQVRVLPSDVSVFAPQTSPGVDIVITGATALPDPVVTVTDDGWLVAEFAGTSAYPWAALAAGRAPGVQALAIERSEVAAVEGCAVVARIDGPTQCETLRVPGTYTIILRLTLAPTTLLPTTPTEEKVAGVRQESRSLPDDSGGKSLSGEGADQETLADILGNGGEGPLVTPSGGATEGIEIEVAPASDVLPEVTNDGTGLYSLNMAEEDVGVALKALARQSKTNIAVASGVSGKVSLELNDVTVEDALRYITELTSLAYYKDGNTYIVTKASEAVEAPPVVVPPLKIIKTYTTSHVSAAQLAVTIRELFEPDGLVVKAGPSPVIPSLDESQTSAVTGVTSTALGSESKTEDDGSRVLILRGPEPVVQSALDACRQLDTRRPQVRIDVLVMDISDDALKTLGLTWTWSTIGLRERDTSEGIKFGTFGREPVNIDATLTALGRDDDARLLARPVVSVVDGGRAFVLIGERILYPVLIGYTQAQTPIFDKGEERVGIYMQVAPHISEDGEITLTIYPQVSVVTDYLEVNGASYPQISTREAQTTIRVRSGDQVVIGGLIQDNDIHAMRRIPGLSKIPLFGELFKWHSDTKRRSEVVIFMRPVLVTSPEDTHPSPIGDRVSGVGDGVSDTQHPTPDTSHPSQEPTR